MSLKIGEAIQIVHDVEFKSPDGQALDTKIGDIAIVTGDKKLYFISGNSKGLKGCIKDINVLDKYDTYRMADFIALDIKDTLSEILCQSNIWGNDEANEKDYMKQLKQAILIALNKIFM